MRRIPSPFSGVRRVIRVARLVDRASRAYDASHLAVLRRAFDLHRRLGFAMDEVAATGALNPAVPRDLIDRMSSRKELRPLQARLNPPALWPLTENKLIFYRVCEAAGFPVPTVHAVFSRTGDGWTRDGATPHDEQSWATALLRVLPDEFVSKPTEGHFGVDVRLFRRTGTTVSETGTSTVLTLGSLPNQLASRARFDTLLLQDRVHNHEAIVRLAGTETLQTLRVVTVLSGTNDVQALVAYSKIVAGDAAVDNYHDASTGNGMSGIDLKSGRLSAALLPREDNLDRVEVAEHPRTGLAIAGFQLPFWNETLELVHEAARAFAPARSLGWDVAITPTGPVLIEANALWGPINEGLAMGPVLERLRDAIADPRIA